MSARLYVTFLSHPSKAAIAMVALKQLPHRVVNLTSGLHPYLVRALDFKALPDHEQRPGARAARRLFPTWEGEMPYFDIPGA